MKKLIVVAVFFLFALGLIACQNVLSPNTDTTVTADEPVAIPTPVQSTPAPDSKWWGGGHIDLATLAGQHMGFSRATTMGSYADDPDTNDGGWSNLYYQQLSHAYMYTDIGNLWYWGTANLACQDWFNTAKANYSAGSKANGDKYLGYATHYMADVSNSYHADIDYQIWPSAATHAQVEQYIGDHWADVMNYIRNDYYYYAVSDPNATVKAIALHTHLDHNAIYSAYQQSDKTNFMNLEKENIKMVARYLKGLIKYCLDQGHGW